VKTEDCLDWVLNGGTCIDACLLGDATRSFQLYDITHSKT